MSNDSVLVVECDAEERRRIGSWLEDDGFSVIGCPGPQGPDYTCLGGRGLPCPLVGDADIVVLDLMLASDEVMLGSAGWQLLLYYVTNGKKVVALSDSSLPSHPRSESAVSVLPRPTHRESLIAAVRALAQRGGPDPSLRGAGDCSECV